MMVKMSDGIGKIVEGYNSVISALENNRVLEIIALEKNLDSKKVKDLIKIAQQKKVEVKNIKSKNEWEFTSTEYVAAICVPKTIYSEYDLKKFDETNFIVCDHIQDTNNLGAIARSAASFDFNVMCVPERRSARLSERTFKISSGGLEKIDILEYKSIFSLIKKFQSLNVWTIGLDMDGEAEIESLDLGNQKLAFFIGSEEKGLSDEIKNKLDSFVRIKMSKNVESLNVSVAAGIAMQHIFIKK